MQRLLICYDPENNFLPYICISILDIEIIGSAVGILNLPFVLLGKDKYTKERNGMNGVERNSHSGLRLEWNPLV